MIRIWPWVWPAICSLRLEPWNWYSLDIVDQSSHESSLKDAVVRTELACRGCRYNLYGLSADSRCPECGLDISETVIHTVDPAASRLPKITNPRAVGNGLFWLLISLAIATLLLIARPVALRLDALDKSGVQDYLAYAPTYLPIAAGVVILLGLFAAMMFIPRNSNEHDAAIRRDIRVLMTGMIGLSVFCMVLSWLESMPVTSWIVSLTYIALMVSAIVILFGLKGILRAVGQRSRVYRTARGGRQGIRAMIGAMLAAIAGQLATIVVVQGSFPRFEAMAIVVTWMSVLMLLIGLGYLVVNGWWIRKSLCKPPPKLRTILSPRSEWDARD